jgi:2-polyprenyl-6-methoxyphenol hydroxylase-like FAD-dependent oxidoreductase
MGTLPATTDVVIVGDAAHVHSPAGGQGMNTGIQDAVALGHALAAVLVRGDSESQLDEYERTRRPVAEREVAFTDRMTRVATRRRSRARSVRNGIIGVIGRLPTVQRWLAMELAGLRNR